MNFNSVIVVQIIQALIRHCRFTVVGTDLFVPTTNINYLKHIKSLAPSPAGEGWGRE
jgi:hypothetical protein